MRVQVYLDESWSPEGYFVLGGFISTEDRWKGLSAEWESMLRYGVIARDGQWHFKMAEMSSPDGVRRVPAFARIIERHAICAISFRFRIRELRRALGDIYLPFGRLDWTSSNWGDPYYFGCRNLMYSLLTDQELKAHLPYADNIEFIFDENSEKGPVIAAWEDMSKRLSTFGAPPRFEDDRKFLPLQAADLWSWWMRKWSEDGATYPQMGFPGFNSSLKIFARDDHPNQEAIAKFLGAMVYDQLPAEEKWRPLYVLNNGNYWEADGDALKLEV
jgi:hypothetical protein